MTADYAGLLLNDLQGGPSSCGCGIVQCRWALDDKAPSTATIDRPVDAAGRFLTAVARFAPGKDVIPVSTTECEEADLPQKLLAACCLSTGLSGDVPCHRGRCPAEFAKQYQALTSSHDGAIGVLLLHREFQRVHPAYGSAPTAWPAKGLEYLQSVLAAAKVTPVPTERLWLVVQMNSKDAAENAAIRAEAQALEPGWVLLSRIKLDQSYEPRIVSVDVR